MLAMIFGLLAVIATIVIREARKGAPVPARTPASDS